MGFGNMGSHCPLGLEGRGRRGQGPKVRQNASWYIGHLQKRSNNGRKWDLRPGGPTHRRRAHYQPPAPRDIDQNFRKIPAEQAKRWRGKRHSRVATNGGTCDIVRTGPLPTGGGISIVAPGDNLTSTELLCTQCQASLEV